MQGFIREINTHASYRILCVSERSDSVKMWNIYSQNHQGIVLRIFPSLKKDSKFSLFRKVEYRAKRPPLYDDTLSFLENGLFGNQNTARTKSLESIIYTKTLEWEHEKEYRLAIPVPDGIDWNTMPYHPEEIAELCLGAKMNDTIKREVIDLAKAVNPEIGIFQSIIEANGQISFRKQ